MYQRAFTSRTVSRSEIKFTVMTQGPFLGVKTQYRNERPIITTISTRQQRYSRISERISKLVTVPYNCLYLLHNNIISVSFEYSRFLFIFFFCSYSGIEVRIALKTPFKNKSKHCSRSSYLVFSDFFFRHLQDNKIQRSFSPIIV